MPFRGGSGPDLTWINNKDPAAVNAMARAKVLHDANRMHAHANRGFTGGDVYRGLSKEEVASILPRLSKESSEWDEEGMYEALPGDASVSEQILYAVQSLTDGSAEVPSSSTVKSVERYLNELPEGTSASAVAEQIGSDAALALTEAMTPDANLSMPRQQLRFDDAETEGMEDGTAPLSLSPTVPQPPTPTLPATPIQNPYTGPQLERPTSIPRAISSAIRQAVENSDAEGLATAAAAAVEVQAAIMGVQPTPQQAQRAVRLIFSRYLPPGKVHWRDALVSTYKRAKAPRTPGDSQPYLSNEGYYEDPNARARAEERGRINDESRRRQLIYAAPPVQPPAEAIAPGNTPATWRSRLRSLSLAGKGFSMRMKRKSGGSGVGARGSTIPNSSFSRDGTVDTRSLERNVRAFSRGIKKDRLPSWYPLSTANRRTNYTSSEDLKKHRWGRPWRFFEPTRPHPSSVTPRFVIMKPNDPSYQTASQVKPLIFNRAKYQGGAKRRKLRR